MHIFILLPFFLTILIYKIHFLCVPFSLTRNEKYEIVFCSRDLIRRDVPGTRFAAREWSCMSSRWFKRGFAACMAHNYSSLWTRAANCYGTSCAHIKEHILTLACCRYGWWWVDGWAFILMRVCIHICDKDTMNMKAVHAVFTVYHCRNHVSKHYTVGNKQTKGSSNIM